MLTFLFVPFLLLSSCILVVDGDDDYDYTEARNAVVDAAGAEQVRIDARAGELEIRGRADLTEVRVNGTAAASRERLLEDIELEAYRNGDEIRIVVHLPRSTFGNTRLDLIIDAPAGLHVRVDDSSGNAEVEGVASLEIDDSSGDIILRDIAGDVRIDDSSGGIDADGIDGEVWVRDSSGDIELFNIGFGVVVDDDSSGDIEIDGVSGDVLIREDSSGDIDVSNVTGDFTVERDGSGSIRYRDIGGTVDIPERK